MFDNYVGAKTAKTGAWTAELVLAAVVLHVFAGAALLVKSWWTISEIDRPTRASAGLSSAPPPPPPPPGGSNKKVEKKVKVKKVKEVTQIDERKIKPKIEDASTDDSQDEGVEGGVEGGVVGGVVGGVIGGVEGGVLGGTLGGDPPPPPPMDEPKMVLQVALEQQRISGDKDIQPPNDIATKISREGKRVVGVVKMCLNTAGNVKKINMLKSTGHSAYDAKIKSKMRLWKYRPFKVNGKSVPVCTSVTFIYIPH
jgi:protein TonB